MARNRSHHKKQLNIRLPEQMNSLETNGVSVKSNPSISDDAIVDMMKNEVNSVEGAKLVEEHEKDDLTKTSPSGGSDRYRKVIEKCNERISFDPNNEFAYLERGDAYIHLDNPKEALHDYKKVIEINPQFIKAYYGMATALVKLGLNRQAMTWVLKSMELEDQMIES